jgi:hypothetical protein
MNTSSILELHFMCGVITAFAYLIGQAKYLREIGLTKEEYVNYHDKNDYIIMILLIVLGYISFIVLIGYSIIKILKNIAWYMTK